MRTFRELLDSFDELSKVEKLHISSYEEYLKLHSNDNKFDYISDVFVSDKILGEKKIATMNHDRFSTPNYHSHRFMEINYILSGDFINTIEGQEINMHKGDICILPPLVFHYMDLVERDVDKRKDSYAIHLFINTDAIKELFPVTANESFSKFINGIINGESHRKFAFFRCSDPDVSGWLAKLLYFATQRYVCTNSAADEELGIHLAHAFIAEMLNPERYTLSFSSSFTGNSSSTNDIIRYIHENFRTVTLEDVAQRFNYSFTYASKLIKQRTGLGFAKMLSDLRLEHACHLLLHTNSSVQDIAIRCGYNNIEHFHRSFKNKYSVTPTMFREMNTNK